MDRCIRCDGELEKDFVLDKGDSDITRKRIRVAARGLHLVQRTRDFAGGSMKTYPHAASSAECRG